MSKADLLKHIAETAYNVGFGAKIHFATYDIVEKAPGWIGLSSTAVGIFALFNESLSGKAVSALFIILGVCGLYISFYNDHKNKYSEKGVELTKLFNELKALYMTVKSSTDTSLDAEKNTLSVIESKYCDCCLNKQIFMSGWYAHYKFFWQNQIEWIDEQKRFGFWRDKIPLSLILTAFAVFFIGSAFALPALIKLVLCSAT